MGGDRCDRALIDRGTDGGGGSADRAARASSRDYRMTDLEGFGFAYSLAGERGAKADTDGPVFDGCRRGDSNSHPVAPTRSRDEREDENEGLDRLLTLSARF